MSVILILSKGISRQFTKHLRRFQNRQSCYENKKRVTVKLKQIIRNSEKEFLNNSLEKNDFYDFNFTNQICFVRHFVSNRVSVQSIHRRQNEHLNNSSRNNYAIQEGLSVEGKNLVVSY